jgi:hypothetical protein
MISSRNHATVITRIAALFVAIRPARLSGELGKCLVFGSKSVRDESCFAR